MMILSLRWWLHDGGLPVRDIHLLSQDRFHPAISCGNHIWFRQGVTVFHLVFVYIFQFFLSPHGRPYKITWEDFVGSKRDPGSTKEGSCLAGMKLFTWNCRIQFMKSLWYCWDRGRMGQNFIPVKQDHVIST